MSLGRFDLGFPNQGGSDSTCWLERRPAWMGKPYSMDLRERVVAAVETGGLSCHQAAAQFGVGISTAIVWVRRLRETGSVAPGQMGGHKPNAKSIIPFVCVAAAKRFAIALWRRPVLTNPGCLR